MVSGPIGDPPLRYFGPARLPACCLLQRQGAVALLRCLVSTGLPQQATHPSSRLSLFCSFKQSCKRNNTLFIKNVFSMISTIICSNRSSSHINSTESNKCNSHNTNKVNACVTLQRNTCHYFPKLEPTHESWPMTPEVFDLSMFPRFTWYF